LPRENGPRTLPTIPAKTIAAIATSLALAACAASSTGTTASDITPAATTSDAAAPASSGAQRDLTADEKKIIMHAVQYSLSNPGSAKYHWTKFPVSPDSDQPAYCAWVDAQSPHAAYNGHQAFIVDTQMTGGHITSAALGLIAGGKDVSIVASMCAEHGLDPNKSS
jgi:hypothetical protein